MAAPESLADHHHRFTAGVVVFSGEGAAQNRNGSQGREEISSDCDSWDALRIAGAGEGKAPLHDIIGCDMLKTLLVIAPGEEIGDPEAAGSAAGLFEERPH